MGDCACDVSIAQLDSTAPLASVYLELTPVCHNACPGCSNIFAHSDAQPALSVVEWDQVFERLLDHKPRLRFTGGEPTLHPEFEQIIGQAQTSGFTFSVFTNARWREPTHIARFLASLAGLECVLISLHGARAQSHEAFTATSESFIETVANIQQVVNTGVQVNTSTVITRQNYTEMPEIIALSQALGAGHAIFSRYIGVESAPIEASLSQINLAVAAVEQAGHNGSTGRVKFGTPIPHCFTPNNSNGCMAGFSHVTIDPWGNVKPCGHVPLTAGNILEQPLETIMQSPVMQEWRRGYLAQCKGCAQQNDCFAGCRAMALLRGKLCDPLIIRNGNERQQVDWLT
jgi:radical SAM protein with 4Fe4S-binding SPASM domain